MTLEDQRVREEDEREQLERLVKTVARGARLPVVGCALTDPRSAPTRVTVYRGWSVRAETRNPRANTARDTFKPGEQRRTLGEGLREIFARSAKRKQRSHQKVDRYCRIA